MTRCNEESWHSMWTLCPRTSKVRVARAPLERVCRPGAPVNRIECCRPRRTSAPDGCRAPTWDEVTTLRPLRGFRRLRRLRPLRVLHRTHLCERRRDFDGRDRWRDVCGLLDEFATRLLVILLIRWHDSNLLLGWTRRRPCDENQVPRLNHSTGQTRLSACSFSSVSTTSRVATSSPTS